MKKKLNLSLLSLFCIPVFALLVFYGCKRSSNDVQPLSTTYSGRELFTGIMLRQGPVASQIPIINESKIDWSTQPEKIKTKGEKFNNDILDQIDKSDPTFFASFQKKIQSGDQIQIQFALASAATAFFAAVNKFPEYAASLNEGRKIIAQIDINKVTNADGVLDENKLTQELNKLPLSTVKTNGIVSENCCSAFIVCAAAVAVWVVAGVNLAVVSNVAGAIAGYLYLALYGPAAESAGRSVTNQNNLASDMIVNQIATNLNTSN